MRHRAYYSIRTGKNPNVVEHDLPSLLAVFRAVYAEFRDRGYLQESLGFYCERCGGSFGAIGRDTAAYVFRKLRKANLWPIESCYREYAEDDLFDIVEFLYDWVSKPSDGEPCPSDTREWHTITFDKKTGQQEFRDKINDLLLDYKDGYELSAEGEILALADEGLGTLVEAKLPTYDPGNIDGRVAGAVLKFRRHRSSVDDRRDAIRDLADVLEFLRPKLKEALTTKDEADLFNIANNFGIRHHDGKQKTEYDKPIWYSWMFYYYLATIHAAVRLIHRYESAPKPDGVNN